MKTLLEYLHVSAFLLMLMGVSSAHSAIIYLEDFNDASIATKGVTGSLTDMAGVTKWSIDIPSVADVYGGGIVKFDDAKNSKPADHFRVENEAFEVLDSDGLVHWETSIIDITGKSKVAFSIKVIDAANGHLDHGGQLKNRDFINVYYSLDGGVFTLMDDQPTAGFTRIGDFPTNPTITQNILNGHTSIKIRVSTRTNANTERIRFDDVKVFFTPPPIFPGGVATDLSLWLKADAGVIGGTTVTGWEDQSVNANDFTDNGVGTQPNSMVNSMNFNPTITFDGRDDLLEVTAVNLLEDANSSVGTAAIYTVIKANTPIDVEAVFMHEMTADRVSPYLASSGQVLHSHLASPTYSFVNGNNSYDVAKLISGTRAGVTLKSLENGLLINTATMDDSSGYAPLANRSTIGGRDQTTSNRYSGDIAELIVYNQETATATDRLQIESYLAIKYGLTLDSSVGSYKSALGVNVWDNITYWNDVFGLGRDDNASLHQQISKSENNTSILTLSTDANFTAANGTHTPLDDGSYFMLGNNNADARAWTTSLSTVGYARIAREWKVRKTGSVGVVNLQVDVDDGELNMPTFFGDLYISINGDTPVVMTDVGLGKWTIAHDFGDADIFTFVVENNAKVEWVENTSSTDESRADNFLTLYVGGVNNIAGDINVTVTGGSAISGTDYTFTTQTISIVAGEHNGTELATFTAPTLTQDALVEGDETITFGLSNLASSSVTEGDANGDTFQVITAVYTISNDDSSEVQFRLTRSSGVESIRTATLELNLSNASATDINVTYTVSGTATGSGTDYNLSSGTLSILAGQLSGTIDIVNIVDDLIVEIDETVIVSLSTVVGAVLGTNEVHTYTIEDNDVVNIAIPIVTGTIIPTGEGVPQLPSIQLPESALVSTDSWYIIEDDDEETVITYDNEGTADEVKSTINISNELDLEQVESESDNEIRLNITGPEVDAPSFIAEVIPNACDASSYKAFVRLFQNNGSVETGYSYSDPICQIQDASIFDGQQLKFVPGTKVRLEKTEDRGGMVIIIDAQLNEATKFGER